MHLHVNNMKIYNTILIVLLIGFISVVFRYNISRYNFIKNNTGEDQEYILNNIISIDNPIHKKELSNIPGPLKKVDPSLLSLNNREIKLSKNGVIENTNKMRKEHNLPPLKEDNKLDLSAWNKLQDMFDKQYFEHESPDGKSVGDLGKEVFYEYIIIGENLALGNFKDDQALVGAWMASEGHRANILNTKYTDIGVAVGSGMYEGRNVWLAVQHFGRSSDTCPSIDTLLKSTIELDQATVEKLDSDLKLRKEKIDSGEVYEGLSTSEQIVKFNTLVEQYNLLLINLKEKMSNYNTQVQAYNKCIQ